MYSAPQPGSLTILFYFYLFIYLFFSFNNKYLHLHYNKSQLPKYNTLCLYYNTFAYFYILLYNSRFVLFLFLPKGETEKGSAVAFIFKFQFLRGLKQEGV